MKKILTYIVLFVSIAAFSASVSSCSRKSGCPAYDEAVSKPKKNGNFNKGKSQLFDKKMRKRMAQRG
ncbi:MAG TPA: hypothetical protein PLC76_08745 [Saprospiraceae bacterium]|jgi:hypothetical protein|nr:hypothetical protein [Candidatus Parvibacillus calidus]MBX2937532.1 hypothetical protein [Saprospiraceae bacterium]MBX7177977.1 hypothetical protein [Saprospiraceae bacterium]MCB0589702.1 hypothetical protein [Saprospiraceae bacterium]MCC7149531.1 hypothetical protein [Saprospiraceae bacterium]